MAPARTFTAQNFSLVVAGVACGFVDSVDGGGVVADVADDLAPGPGHGKHVGQPRFEEIDVQFGLGLAQDVYDWIAATWNGTFQVKDGSIVIADANFNAHAEQQFFQALPTRVTIPALDAAAKDTVALTLGITPQRVVNAKGTGKVPPAPISAKQKEALRCNFRLELDGVDATKVRRIESFTVQVPLTVEGVGDTRPPTRVPTSVEFPNLRVTIADGPTAGGWQTWAEDFLIKGNNDASHEKSGAIVFLGHDLKTELGRIVLHNVGIFALRHSRRDRRVEAVPALIADLYCERMELAVGKPAAQPERVRPVIAPVRPLGIRR